MTTPFLVEIVFYATQEKVCHKFCDNSIFGRKFVFLMQHRQKFAINFVTTPFLVECFFYATQAKVCHKFCDNSIFSRRFVSKNAGLFYVWSTSKYSYLYWRSRFGNISFPNFDLQILDIIDGLFGLYGLEGQTKGIPQIINTS